MALAISLGLFVFLAAAITVYGYRLYARPGRLLDQISAAAARPAEVENAAHGYRVTTVLQWVGERVPRSPQQSSVTRRLLGMAGYKSDAAVPIYVGSRLVATALSIVVALIIANQMRMSGIKYFLTPAITGFAVFSGAAMVLDFLVKGRKERIRFALPDALDLLVVCVESGLGLDQAITKVTSELTITHPDISQELALTSLEIRAGLTRADALRNLAARTGEEELRKFTALLIQTDRFGTSLADSLRTHANFMRVRRKNEAEERAGKLGVKLTFPIFFFILPSIMVIAAGPAFLKLAKELLPALGRGAF